MLLVGYETKKFCVKFNEGLNWTRHVNLSIAKVYRNLSTRIS